MGVGNISLICHSDMILRLDRICISGGVNKPKAFRFNEEISQ